MSHRTASGRSLASGDDELSHCRVGLVLLNWNGADLTIPCLRSVLDSDRRPSHVLVFDNGSQDGSADEIERSVSGVCVVRNPTNVGFTGGCNAGISAVLASGADFVWLLNNDTVVDPSCLYWLLRAALARPDAAAVTGKILLQDDTSRIWYAGARFNPLTFASAHRGQDCLDKGQYDSREAVPFISGCCMLIRAKALKRIGAFHGGFFAYFEDLEWCLRARKSGMPLIYEPHARLFHKVSATARRLADRLSGGATGPFTHYHTTRNHVFVIRLHARRPGQFLLGIALVILGRLWLSSGLILLRRFDKLRAVWAGVWHGLHTDLRSPV